MHELSVIVSSKMKQTQILNFPFICTVCPLPPHIYNMRVDREPERAIQYRWHENRRHDYVREKKGSSRRRAWEVRGDNREEELTKTKCKTHMYDSVIATSMYGGTITTHTHDGVATKRGRMAHALNLSTRETEAGRASWLWDQFGLKFQVSRDYIVRHCLKIKKNKINRIKKRVHNERHYCVWYANLKC